MRYEIISSGSQGNAVKLTFPNGITIMVDIGLSFKLLKPHLQDCHMVFISHIHGDHLNMGAYNQLRKNYPWIKVIGCAEVNDKVVSKKKKPLDYVVHNGSTLEINGTHLTFLDAPHEVENLGIVGECQGQRFLYSTDLMTTYAFEEYLDKNDIQLDLLLLEANYDANVIGFMEHLKLHTGYDVYGNGSYRHLSLQANEKFAEKYLKPDGFTEHLHQSGTYYSYDNLKNKLELGDEYDEQYGKFVASKTE